MTKTGFYSVTKISPHLDNKRHKSVTSDNEAIRTLLGNEKKHRILGLAKDIVALGKLDPSSKLIITEDKKNSGHYIVLEGNRRITALKTLTNPQLCKDLPTANEFKKLSTSFMNAPITKVECVELSPKEASLWIKRKHYNAMGGASTVEWDPMAKAKSDAEDGKYAQWLACVEFLEKQGQDIGYIEEGIDGISTTVDRVLASSHMKEMLGLSISKDGSIIPENGKIDKAVELLLAIFDKIISDSDFKETNVSTTDQQKEYLSQFASLSVRKHPPKQEKENEDSDNGTSSSSTGSSGKGKNESKEEEKGSKGTGSKKPKKEREKLAAKGLNIQHGPLNNFYQELTKFPVKSYKHSAAGILRIFLEKAVMVFLEEMKIKHPGGKKWDNFEIKLREKVKAVLDTIDPAKKNSELKPARDIANGSQDGLHSLNMLNDYIHNHKSLPAPSELITTWDRLHAFYDEIFKYIAANKP